MIDYAILAKTFTQEGVILGERRFYDTNWFIVFKFDL